MVVHLQAMWQQYRDELVTMGLVFVISAVGIFFMTSRFLAPEPSVSSTAQAPLPTQQSVLGEQSTTTPPTPTYKLGIITPTAGVASSAATPTPAQVPYGAGRSYAYENYQIEFLDPRLIFENGAERRRFVIDVVIKNISVVSGIKNSLAAAIVKDGNVIVPEAPLSLSESKLILPSQQLSFTARLSLIEGTDVVTLTFAPDDLEPVTHELR